MSGVGLRARHSFSGQAKQGGVALIISLVLLLVMTIVGLSGIRIITSQERMVSYTLDRSVAFQAAEAALRGAEKTLGCLLRRLERLVASRVPESRSWYAAHPRRLQRRAGSTARSPLGVRLPPPSLHSSRHSTSLNTWAIPTPAALTLRHRHLLASVTVSP
jgi:Tfp pilus assembly protein PilX